MSDGIKPKRRRFLKFKRTRDPLNKDALLIKHSEKHFHFQKNEAKRHTLKVRFLKAFLPSVIGFVVFLTVAWQQYNYWTQPIDKELKSIQKKLATSVGVMSKPQLIGVDEKKQAYHVTADHATQTKQDSVDLHTPHAKLDLGDQAMVNVSSAKGTLSTDQRLLHLNGDVVMQHGTNMTLSTTSSKVDLSQKKVTGEDKVFASSASGNIEAKGFEMDSEHKKVIFKGRPHLSLKTNVVKKGS